MDGDQNGGSPVIDYQVTYDNTLGTVFEVLQSNILVNEYTVLGLTRG